MSKADNRPQLRDPLEGEFLPESKPPKAPKPPKEKKPLFKGKKKQNKDHPLRIEEVEDFDDLTEEELNKVVSLYMPHRRARRLAMTILNMDRMRLFLLFAILVVLILFLMSFMQEKMGNFTINLDRLELFRKGIAIADDGEFTQPTARLAASPVANATNISEDDIPFGIEDLEGNNNGANYMAYTYYIRNAGKEDVSYCANIEMVSSSKGAEDAVRVAVWRNGERTLYAEPSADGTPEPGCTNFVSRNLACSYYEEDFKVGNVDKYTIVIWLDGNDPECVDKIVGGSVEFTMNVVSASQDDTSLLVKYIQDIKDTLTGNKPIGAAGVDSPDFEKYDNVTWETRRNQ